MISGDFEGINPCEYNRKGHPKVCHDTLFIGTGCAMTHFWGWDGRGLQARKNGFEAAIQPIPVVQVYLKSVVEEMVRNLLNPDQTKTRSGSVLFVVSRQLFERMQSI